MEPLADITAKLLAETALSAAAPRVGEKIKSMTNSLANSAGGLTGDFQGLIDKINEVPRDISDLIDSLSLQAQATLAESAASAQKPVVLPTPPQWPEKPEGTVRFFHGGTPVEQDEEHGRWAAPTKDYAEGYARKGGPEAGKTLQYVDVPVEAPWVQQMMEEMRASIGDQKDPQSLLQNVQLPIEVSRQLRTLSTWDSDFQRPVTTASPTVHKSPVAAPSPPTPTAPPEDAHQANLRWRDELIASVMARTPEQSEETPPPPAAPPVPPVPPTGKPWWQTWMENRGKQATRSSSPPPAAPPVPPVPPSPPAPPSPPVPPKNRLAGMLAAMFGIGRTAAGGVAQTAMAAAPTIAATAGGLASPAIGAAGAALAATGPIGAVVAVAGAVTAGLVALPKLLKEFGTNLAESNRELASYSAQIAQAYAGFDQDQFRRKLDLATSTSGSASFATDQWSQTLDSLQGPLKALATTANLWSSGVAIISRNLPLIASMLTGGLVSADKAAGFIEKMQKDIEKMANGGNERVDWGDQLTRSFTGQNLPGRNQPKPPVPPIGGGK